MCSEQSKRDAAQKAARAIPATQNSLVASAPGHPFWAFLLQLAIQRSGTSLVALRRPVPRTVGVDLIAFANYAWALMHPPSPRSFDGQPDLVNGTCILPYEDWHGDPEGIQAGTAAMPRFAIHLGTRTWRSQAAFLKETNELFRPDLGLLGPR